MILSDSSSSADELEDPRREYFACDVQDLRCGVLALDEVAEFGEERHDVPLEEGVWEAKKCLQRVLKDLPPVVALVHPKLARQIKEGLQLPNADLHQGVGHLLRHFTGILEIRGHVHEHVEKDVEGLLLQLQERGVREALAGIQVAVCLHQSHQASTLLDVQIDGLGLLHNALQQVEDHQLGCARDLGLEGRVELANAISQLDLD